MSWRKQITYSEHPNLKARAAHVRGEREFKTYDTSQIRPEPPKAPRIILLVAALIFAALAFWGVSSWLSSCTHQPTLPADQSAQIVIAEGTTLESVAKDLFTAGVIGDVGGFLTKAKEAGLEKNLALGRYEFKGGMKLEEVIDVLKGGPNATISMTVPEGSTIEQVAGIVQEAYKGSITSADFVSEANNAQAFEEEFPFVKGVFNNSLEGFLFPKTYPVLDNATAHAVIAQMLSQYAEEVKTLNYKVPEAAKLSPYDVLKLASVIEKEAASDNRATVASVFYNRLKRDMPLQSDATIAYVIKRDPKPEDLKIDSPYNSYDNKGLPPGPICSPGIECLEAACKPEKTDYLYFYFAPQDGTMKYYFSKTYEQHQEAIAAAS